MLTIALALVAPLAFAQQPSGPAASQDARISPRRAIFAFLDAAHKGDYRRAAQFLHIPDHRRDTEGAELAAHLKTVLDRKLRSDPGVLSTAPEGDLLDGLPPNRELIGTVNLDGRPYDMLLERVEGPEGQKIWLFSSSLMASLPALYGDVGNRSIERHLPAALVERTLGDAELWQWIALLLAVLIAIPGGRLLAGIILRLLRPLASRTRWPLDDALLQSGSRPLRWLFAAILFQWGVAIVAPPLLLRTVLTRVLTAVAYLSLAWLVMRLIDAVAAQVTSAMTRRQQLTTSAAVPLSVRTAKVLTGVIAVIAVLNSWGYNTTALLAGLGVGGLAVALAAQKTLENLFGGMSLISDKPVLVGDFCKFGDRSGVVEDIGLRSTRIRTNDRTVVSVPNGQFSALQIENFARAGTSSGSTRFLPYAATRPRSSFAGFWPISRPCSRPETISNPARG